MVVIDKPKGIQIQIKDSFNNKSKSFTIHGISFEKLFSHIYFYVTQLKKFGHIKLICYKRGEEDGKKTTE